MSIKEKIKNEQLFFLKFTKESRKQYDNNII